jgi:hypothetical protein
MPPDLLGLATLHCASTYGVRLCPGGGRCVSISSADEIDSVPTLLVFVFNVPCFGLRLAGYPWRGPGQFVVVGYRFSGRLARGVGEDIMGAIWTFLCKKPVPD